MIVSGTRDQRMAAVARRQRGLVARDQLVAVGLSDGAIRRRVTRGTLIAEHPSVYRVDPAPTVRLAAEASLLLSLRAGALLSHHSAAALWRIGGADRVIHASVPGGGTEPRTGARIHRSSTLDDLDVRVREGLPVTSPARTLLDCAATTSGYRLERMFTEALTLRLMTPEDVTSVLCRCGPRAGRGVLQALIDAEVEGADLRSDTERRLRALILAAGLPRPQFNAELYGFTADVFWPQHNLVVEADSYGFHTTRWAYERDRRKDAAFRANNLTTMRFSRRQIRDQALLVVAQIAAGLAGAAGPPPSTPSRDGRAAAGR